MRKIINLSPEGLIMALLIVGPGYAQNADFDRGIDAKSVLTQIKETTLGNSPAAQAPAPAVPPQQEEEVVAKCQSRNNICYRILHGDGELLTEKLRKVQELYNLWSVGCPGEWGDLGIYIRPIQFSAGRSPDSTRYEIVGLNNTGVHDFAHPGTELEDRVSQLENQGFEVTQKCRYERDGAFVLLEIRSSYKK